MFLGMDFPLIDINTLCEKINHLSWKDITLYLHIDNKTAFSL